jgi:hypothetical protein
MRNVKKSVLRCQGQFVKICGIMLQHLRAAIQLFHQVSEQYANTAELNIRNGIYPILELRF